ncbi:MAG: DUF6249 domain-containing protein [Verrucomicrobiota bacterium]
MNAIKSLFLICVFLTFFAWSVIGQSPNVSASAQASPASPVASVSPANAVSPSPTESDLERSIKHKTKRHHFGIHIDPDKDNESIGVHGDDDIPRAVFPIVAVVMMAVFGAPVAIVAVILYFSMSRSRQLHKTVRMMVEKGQEVPAALLAPPPPAVRQRSDMRRGVVLMMVGIGLMVFFGAVNDWDGGAWALGIIPFLIGAGYLLVWKLEGNKKDIPPLPPTA